MTTATDPLLRQDIRRLGRLLGGIVRTQHGEAAFALIERIRRLSTGLPRSELDAALAPLSADHGQRDERTRRGIHLAINGIAAGLRNSG